MINCLIYIGSPDPKQITRKPPREPPEKRLSLFFSGLHISKLRKLFKNFTFYATKFTIFVPCSVPCGQNPSPRGKESAILTNFLRFTDI